MRRISHLGLVALLLAPLAACGDSGGSTTTDTVGADTATATDTVTSDTMVAQDTTVADTMVAQDTAVADDTMVAQDTAVADDTMVAQDTAVADDTTVTQDTTASDTTETDTSGTCQDDDLAGTEAAPADLATVLAGDPTFHICPDVHDVFSFSANAGDVVKINLIIDVADHTADTTPGVDDVDMYLYAGSIADENELSGGVAATAAAVEQIVFTVETAGTFILVVEDYGGSSVDYGLTFDVATGCAHDADCTGGAICYAGIDDANYTLAQECRAYTVPACGQSTAEDSPSSHSDGTAVAFGSVATDGAFTGGICGDDVDVFAFDLAAADTLTGTVSASLTGNALLLALFVDPDGAFVGDPIVLDADSGVGELGVTFVGRPGSYHLYLDYFPDGSETGDVAYTITASVAAACKLDADCTGGNVCGAFTATGPIAMCVPEAADPCGSDADNSQTHATALTSGTPVTSEVVCDTGNDWYKLTVGATSDITATVTWSTSDDLDLYFLGADGTPYGAGWYGDGTETVLGANLPAGTYFFLVDQYTTDGSGTAGVAYSITATATPSAAACTADSACYVGGGIAGDDPGFALACNTTTGACEAPVAADFGSVAPGGTCFSDAGMTNAGQCALGGFCLAATCTTECTAQADCDASFGSSGAAYCQAGSVFGVSFDFCIPSCDSPTATSHLWGDAECASLGFASCDGATHQCLEP